jgi:hypothetical protein
MGEIAEMMLCGILCEGCGVYLGDDVGYPRRCGSCKFSDTPPPPPERPSQIRRKHKRRRRK